MPAGIARPRVVREFVAREARAGKTRLGILERRQLVVVRRQGDVPPRRGAVEARAFLARQGVDRNMPRLEVQRPAQRVAPGGAADARHARQQVEPEIRNPRPARARRRAHGVGRPVPPAQPAQHGVVKRLGAEADPVDARRGQNVRLGGGQRAGIGLDGPLAAGAQGKAGDDAAEPSELRGGEHGGRAAADVDRADPAGAPGGRVGERRRGRALERRQVPVGQRRIVAHRVEGAVGALAVAERHMQVQPGWRPGRPSGAAGAADSVPVCAACSHAGARERAARQRARSASSSASTVSGTSRSPRPRPSWMSGIGAP